MLRRLTGYNCSLSNGTVVVESVYVVRDLRVLLIRSWPWTSTWTTSSALATSSAETTPSPQYSRRHETIRLLFDTYQNWLLQLNSHWSSNLLYCTNSASSERCRLAVIGLRARDHVSTVIASLHWPSLCARDHVTSAVASLHWPSHWCLSHLIHVQIKQRHWCKQRHVPCARMRWSSTQVFRLDESYVPRWTLQCSPGNIEILSIWFLKMRLHYLTVCKNIPAWKYCQF